MALTERDDSLVGADPLVTVVMPTFNRAELIVQAIQSVVDQTYRNWELVVVDDGSNDRTVERLGAFDEPRLKVVGLARCGNVARLRNVGAAAGRGEFIAFLDSDDLWHPERLEAQLAALRGTDASWCYADHGLMTDEGARIPLRAGQFRPLSGRIAASLLLFETGVSINTLLVPRALFDSIGGFDESLYGPEDLDLVLRLADAADAIAIPAVLAWVRDHEGRTTRSERNHAEQMANVFRKIADHSDDPALTELARSCWASHLAQAGGYLISKGDVIRGGTLVWHSLVNGARLRHCLYCLARGVLRLSR